MHAVDDSVADALGTLLSTNSRGNPKYPHFNPNSHPAPYKFIVAERVNTFETLLFMKLGISS